MPEKESYTHKLTRLRLAKKMWLEYGQRFEKRGLEKESETAFTRAEELTGEIRHLKLRRRKK